MNRWTKIKRPTFKFCSAYAYAKYANRRVKY